MIGEYLVVASTSIGSKYSRYSFSLGGLPLPHILYRLCQNKQVPSDLEFAHALYVLIYLW